MQTVRGIENINQRFINDLKALKEDDFIARPEHHESAAISVRNRQTIVNGAFWRHNSGKQNAFSQVYHWNPDADMVLFVRWPVRLADRFTKSVPNRNLALASSLDRKKKAYQASYSFSRDAISHGKPFALVAYIDECRKSMEA